MSRRHSQFRSWSLLSSATVFEERTDQVDRANILSSAPIIAGMGFVISRVVAIAIADASVLSFLWGLVIGLTFATAGVVVLASTETDGRSHSPDTRHPKRIPFVTAGGILLLALLTGIVLGIVL
jgi:purine-cytosine permease-like protein